MIIVPVSPLLIRVIEITVPKVAENTDIFKVSSEIPFQRNLPYVYAVSMHDSLIQIQDLKFTVNTLNWS